MNPADNYPAPFRLRDWLVQPELNRISGPGGEHRIEPRVMSVLLALAAAPGRVVPRETLLDTVWTDTIVGEEILTRAVSELRRVFGDDPRSPTYIETIRQHGYRLIAPVEAAADDAAPPPDAGEVASAPPPATAAPRSEAASPRDRQPAAAPRVSGRPVALVVAALAVTVLGLAAWRLATAPGTPRPASAPAPAVPLTSLPGREMHPALSADGARVAFVWSGPDGRAPGIHIKQRSSETLLKVAAEPGWPAWPVWSPDGQSLAFVQTGDSLSAVCRVAALGGAVERLHAVAGLIEGLDWSPDGARLAFAASGEGGQFRLHELDLATRRVTTHPAPEDGAAGAILPRYSPDGRHLAWIAVGQAGEGRVLVRRLDAPAGDRGRVVARGLTGLQGLAWNAAGDALIYAAAPAGADNLWRVNLAGGDPQWIPTAGEQVWNPTVARGTGDLAYEQVRVDRDLWRIEVQGRDPWRLATGLFVTSTRWEYGADFDPAGGQVVFVSARSGRPALWVARVDGSQPRRLEGCAAAGVTNPRWSPDGRRIAFNAIDEGGARILVAPAQGGPVTVVDVDAEQALLTGWTADGQGLLLGVDRGEGWQICRRDLAGGLRVLTTQGGITAAEAADGSLYHTRPDRAGLWRLAPGATGEPELVISGLATFDRWNWRLGNGWLYWVLRAASGAVLMHHDPATGLSDAVTGLPGLAGSGLAVTPDGGAIVYARSGPAAGDLMLIAGGAP